MTILSCDCDEVGVGGMTTTSGSCNIPAGTDVVGAEGSDESTIAATGGGPVGNMDDTTGSVAGGSHGSDTIGEVRVTVGVEAPGADRAWGCSTGDDESGTIESGVMTDGIWGDVVGGGGGIPI